MKPKNDEIYVHIESASISFSVISGETVIQAAWRNGFYWPTICGGVAECGACRCEVTSGVDHVLAPDIQEQIFFRSHPRLNNIANTQRLACRLKITGPVTIAKTGVKRR